MAPLPNPMYGIIGGVQGPMQAPGGITGNGVGSTPMAVSSDGSKPTYHAAGITLTLYSAAAAVLLEIQGSATKTIRVKHIYVWAQAGTKFFTELELLRSTTVAATGTPVVAAMVPHDTSDAVATAVVNSYAAAAAYGTGHLLLGACAVPLSAPSAAVQIAPCGWDFSRNNDKALIIRGVADVIQVYNTILTLGAGTFGFDVEWEEDNS